MPRATTVGVLIVVALASFAPPATRAIGAERPLSETQTDRFSALERTIIRNYYGVAINPRQRQLFTKRAVIPANTPKQALPKDLAHKLPPLPAGRNRVVIGNSVVLLDTKTNAVLDALPGVAEMVPAK